MDKKLHGCYGTSRKELMYCCRIEPVSCNFLEENPPVQAADHQTAQVNLFSNILPFSFKQREK
jgi:hypothetical protein